MWLFLLILFAIIYLFNQKEMFGQNFIDHITGRATRFDFPTRNMSYDIRGEAYYPRINNLFPWLNSEIGPLN